MNTIIFQKNKKLSAEASANSGFAMLFTVLVISIILAIALGISDLTFKQTILSSLAQSSQAAFYQADSAVECGMLYDRTQLPPGTTVPNAPRSLSCGVGANNLYRVDTSSTTDHIVYQETVSPATDPCFSITFDKTVDENGVVKSNVSGRGYSTCAATAQQVERGLNVSYSY